MAYQHYWLESLPRMLTRPFKVRNIIWHPDDLPSNRNRTIAFPHFTWGWYNIPGECCNYNNKEIRTHYCDRPRFNYLPYGYYMHTIRPLRHDVLIFTLPPECEAGFLNIIRPVSGEYENNDTISGLLTELFKLLNSLDTPGQADRVDSLFLHLVEESTLAVMMTDQDPPKQYQLCMRLKNFIDNNFNDPITLDDICKRFSLSRRALYRNWNSGENGDSPAEYLLKKRLGLAQHLLLTTEMSIQEIARNCGFDNTIYFTQCFRRNFSVSPSMYRKQDQNFTNIPPFTE